MPLNNICPTPFLPVRDQGKAGTCLAFATSFVHERLHNMNDYLSPAYLYGHACKTDPTLDGHTGLTVKAVEKAIHDIGQVQETILQYEDWLKSSDFPNCMHMINQPHFFANLTTIPHNFDNIFQFANKDVPVIIGIRFTDAFFTVDENGFLEEAKQREMGKHALVAIGVYQNQQGRKFLLIRNSWGITWGKNGYAIVSQEYLMERLMFAAILKEKEN